jgi:hypothetical protein
MPRATLRKQCESMALLGVSFGEKMNTNKPILSGVRQSKV